MIQVVVGVVVAADGRVLLAKRPQQAHQGGLWEFPGGKLEPGENPKAGLHRELREELGIEVKAYRPLLRTAHDYGDKAVLLDVYWVSAYDGVPEGKEGQPLAWVTPEGLDRYPLPAADRPIVAAIRLPSTYVFTPPILTGDSGSLLVQLEQRMRHGAKMVQLRVLNLSGSELAELAGRFVLVCREHGALVLINADAELALSSQADGVHLKARQLRSLKCRPPGLKWVGASCHSVEELRRACALGVDFAVLSPVLKTASHPSAQPLGWKLFTQWVDGLPLPVYALGGMNAGMLRHAWDMGAQGIAGISSLWSE